MKATELMISDWVIYDLPDSHSIVKIDGINDRMVRFHNRSFWVSVDKVIPIPLTPEILEKNGLLDERHSEYFVNYNKHDEEFYFYFFGAFAEVKIAISYVHELQHALRLCKIQKEIVL